MTNTSRIIDIRLEDAKKRYAQFEKNAPEHLREKSLAYIRKEIQVWGGGE